MPPKVSKADATKVLVALSEQLPAYSDAFTVLTDFDGRAWTIVGEEGPYEWPFTFPEGDAERGIPDVSHLVPSHLFTEAINHYSIALYPR